MKDFTKSKTGPWMLKEDNLIFGKRKPSVFVKFLRSYWRRVVLSIIFVVAMFSGNHYRSKIWPKAEFSEQQKRAMRSIHENNGFLRDVENTVDSSSVFTAFHVDGTSQSIKVQKDQYFIIRTSGTWEGLFTIQRSGDGIEWVDVYSHAFRHDGNIEYEPKETVDCHYRMNVKELKRTAHNIRHEEYICYGNMKIIG